MADTPYCVVNSREVRRAIFQRISDELPTIRVYDDVPDGTEFPYIDIAGSTEAADETKAEWGSDVTVTVVVYSQYQGAKEAHDLADAISRALTDGRMDLVGAELADTPRLESLVYSRAADGITRQAEMRFLVKVSNP